MDSRLSVCAPRVLNASSGHGVTANQPFMWKTEITSFTSLLSELIHTKVVTVQAELVTFNPSLAFLFSTRLIFFFVNR